MNELTNRVTITMEEYKQLLQDQKEKEAYRDKYWELESQIKKIKELLV